MSIQIIIVYKLPDILVFSSWKKCGSLGKRGKKENE